MILFIFGAQFVGSFIFLAKDVGLQRFCRQCLEELWHKNRKNLMVVQGIARHDANLSGIARRG